MIITQIEAAPPRAAGVAATNIRGDERPMLLAAKQGSTEAAELLVRAHWSAAYRAAYLIVKSREDAEDVVQESFIAALGAMSRFRPDRQFGPWLRRIVINRSLDCVRGTNRRQALASEAEELARLNSSVAESSLTLSDPALVEAIQALPLEQRSVVVMRFVLGFEVNEIARVLAIPRGTVGSRIRRGLDALGAYREEEQG